MNQVILELEVNKYIRTNEPLTDCVVVHCVAGAGKSTLIRNLIGRERGITAYTLGVPDDRSISGVEIKEAKDIEDNVRGIILDEYPLYSGPERNFIAKFCDPYQFAEEVERCHYISYETKRFGEETAKLLRSLGFFCFSGKIDTVSYGDPFEKEVAGQLICSDKDSIKLAENHRTPFKKSCEVRGQEFEVVTYLRSSNIISKSERYLVYLSLTRHRSSLLILNPGGKPLKLSD